MIKEF
jgi:hypothetical protein